MQKSISLVLFITTLFFNPLTLNTVLAQENQETVQKQKIIVQTDLEENIPNHSITCKEMPLSLEVATDTTTTLTTYTTDENGEATIDMTGKEQIIFSCSSTEVTTKDYCWYFPNPAISFKQEEYNKNEKPIYLIGQASPDTCNKVLGESELASGIKKMVPSGSPLPFQNKNFSVATPTPTVVPAVVTQESQDEQELSLWNWLYTKIRSFISL